MKEHRKLTKLIFFDQAYEQRLHLKGALQASSIPSIAIDAPPAVLDALAKNDAWLHNDDAWRALLQQRFSAQHGGFASQIREALAWRKAEGAEYVLLHAVKEERMLLLNLKGGSVDH